MPANLIESPPKQGSQQNGFDSTTPGLGPVAAMLILWRERWGLIKVGLIGALLFTVIAFLIPKKFASTVQLMPPDNQNLNGAALLSAVMGNASLSAAAGDLLGMKSSGDLVIGVLQSRTVADRLIDKFDLRRVYSLKTYEAARRKLANNSEISLDNKSQIIVVRVLDTDPKRAQGMANEYVTALNDVMSKVSSSAARREREFLEERIKAVKPTLNDASRKLAEYSSHNDTFDPKEQGKTMVEETSRLQGELISAEAQLNGLKQIYGNGNARVKEAEARVGTLRAELARLNGGPVSRSSLDAEDGNSSNGASYPSLRKLPLIGTTWTELYREAKIQEAVYENLTKQYELARVEEAKELPSIKVLDAADYPEKKTSPPRTALVVIGAMLALCFACVYVLGKSWWQRLAPVSGPKAFWSGIEPDLQHYRAKFALHRNGH